MSSTLPRSVCVYCGSSGHADEAYKKAAHEMGEALALRGMRVVYGGGHVGLMGLLADAAIKAGGEVVGIIPAFIRLREVQHEGLTELHVVEDMHTRKRMMVDRADAFLILPGGFGTLDETFEILTWRQLGLHNKPIVIYNVNGFWTPLALLLDHIMNRGFAPRDNRHFYKLVERLEDVFTALAEPVAPPSNPLTKWI